MKIAPTTNVKPNFQGVNAKGASGISKNVQNILRAVAATALIAGSTQSLSQEVYPGVSANQLVLNKDYTDLKMEHNQPQKGANQSGEGLGNAVGEKSLHSKKDSSSMKTTYFLGGTIVGALLSGIGVSFLKSKK